VSTRPAAAFLGSRAVMQATLPYRLYLEAGAFAAERERIFTRQWFLVGRDEDVPGAGDWRRVEVAGEQLVLVRGEDDRLRAFANTCRHRGAELCPADGPEAGHAGRSLRCPYHHWTYGLDGRLRAAPHLAEVPPDVALYEAGVAGWAGFTFVSLHPEQTPPLAEQLGASVATTANYPLADLRRGGRLTYEVAANWKVIVENYNECYHCGPVHPELCELVPAFRRGGGAGLEWDHGIPHRDGAWTFTISGTTVRAPFPGLSAEERVRHKGALVYPNLLLSLSADHVAAFTLLPRAPGQTTVVCDFLFAPEAIDASDFDPTDAVNFWDVVNRQDWRIGESVQRGMASYAAERGWFAPMEEDSADIGRWYRRAMGDAIADIDDPSARAGNAERG
jgi:Rieske 2Fe-2S family protein